MPQGQSRGQGQRKKSPPIDDASFNVDRIVGILASIDHALTEFDLAEAREAFRTDAHALWRIVLFEARAAGVSASQIRDLLLRRATADRCSCDRLGTTRATYPTVYGGYRTFEEVSRHLRQLAQDRLVTDATVKRKQRAANRVRGRIGGTKSSPQAGELRDEIRKLTDAYRRSRPYHRHRASTERLVVHLASELQKHPETIKRHLRNLNLK